MPDPTRYTFTGSEQVRPEEVKDTDLTHDSPHHTLGYGRTQAAPGDHKHQYKDLIDLPDAPLDHNHDSVYVNITGDGMQGDLQLQPPVNDTSAARVDWVKNNVGHHVSGPHGPTTTGYASIGAGPSTIPSTGLWFPAKAIPGIWKITMNCYGYLVAPSASNIYVGLLLKWGDQAAASQRNGGPQQTGRLHCSAAMGSNRGALTHVAFVDNRIGFNLGAQAQAQYDGSPTTAQVGYIRLTAEYHPFATELGLASGWTNI